MKKVIFSILFCTFIITKMLSAQDITEQSFVGQWCGQWDKTYDFCLTIKNIDSGAVAKYRWLEHPDGKYKKSTKTTKRVNRNTLKIDNIWFALDETNPEQASAMGIFQYQTRTAILTKQVPQQLSQ